MSSSELTEAGVLGLRDLDTAESDNLSEPRSPGCVKEVSTSGHCPEAPTEAETVAALSRPDLLTELRIVHVLDELIMEEQLEIHKLRHCELNANNVSEGFLPKSSNATSTREREAFRLQLEKEKREVEKLEKSLDKERKAKKHNERARKVLRCSIMDKARGQNTEDEALCRELLSESCTRSQKTLSTAVEHNEETCKTEEPPAYLHAAVGREPVPHDGDPPSCEAAASSCSSNVSYDLKNVNEELEIQPQDCEDITCKPEASLTPEMKPDDGAFDPGGQMSLTVTDSLAEHETPPSTEVLHPHPSAAAQDPGFVELQEDCVESKIVTPPTSPHCLHPNVKDQSNNNNNHLQRCSLSSEHLSEVSTRDEEDTSEAPSGLLRTQSASPPDERAAPQLDELHEDLPDGIQRISGPGSAGLQTHLNIDTVEVLFEVQ